MLRWLAVIGAVLLAAGLGFLAGYVHWGTQAKQAEHLEQRLDAAASEAATLRTQKQDLEQRVEQVAKEQERLAQENEILRKQQTTEKLVGGQGGELPERPPK